MIVTEQTILVTASPDEVFRFMTQLDNAFRWTPSLLEIKELSHRELGMGSRFEMISEFMGRHVTTRLEITDFDPGRRIEAKSIGGPFGVITETCYSPAGEGTRITTRRRISPRGGWKAIEPILPFVLRQRSKKEFALLRRTLESFFGTSGNMHVVSVSDTTVHAVEEAPAMFGVV